MPRQSEFEIPLHHDMRVHFYKQGVFPPQPGEPEFIGPPQPLNPLPLYYMGYLMLHSDAKAGAVAKLLRMAVEGASQSEIERAIRTGEFLIGLGAGVLDIPKLASHAIRLAKLPDQAYNVAKFVEDFEPTFDRRWAEAALWDMDDWPIIVTNEDE